MNATTAHRTHRVHHIPLWKRVYLKVEPHLAAYCLGAYVFMLLIEWIR